MTEVEQRLRASQATLFASMLATMRDALVDQTDRAIDAISGDNSRIADAFRRVNNRMTTLEDRMTALRADVRAALDQPIMLQLHRPQRPAAGRAPQRGQRPPLPVPYGLPPINTDRQDQADRSA
jgi:hypothetical protein